MYTYDFHAVGQAYRTRADIDVRKMEEEIEEGAALRVCSLGSSPVGDEEKSSMWSVRHGCLLSRGL